MRLRLTISILSIFLSGSLVAGVEFMAEQQKLGQEILVKIWVQGTNGTSVPLGGADLPINVNKNVLDLANAYFDTNLGSAFNNVSAPSSYNALGLYKNKALVVRVNENATAGGNGVMVDATQKLVAAVRIPISSMCESSTISWNKDWGQVLRFSNDQYTHSIKDQVTYTTLNSTVQLFVPPITPSLSVSGPTTICQGDIARLSTSNPQGFDVVWERNGTIVSIGPDTLFATSISGTYRVGIRNCDVTEYSSASSVDVINAPMVPAITENQGTLFSSSNSNNQWYLDGVKLTGATAQTFVPTQGGKYSVEVSNTCGSEMSDPFLYTISSLGQGVVANEVGVFPNPYFGKTKIFLGLVDEADVLVEVYDMRGIRIKEIADQHLFSGRYEWDFFTKDIGLASGSYILKIFADGRVYTTTLIEASK